MQRVYPCLHSCLQEEEAVCLGEQFFGLLLEFDSCVQLNVKQQIKPGSIAQTNVIFIKEYVLSQKKKDEMNWLRGCLKSSRYRRRSLYFEAPQN